jgi:hypothetical protein
MRGLNAKSVILMAFSVENFGKKFAPRFSSVRSSLFWIVLLVAEATNKRESLKLATENGLESVAFPAISTGVYRFPPERAAEIAVGTVAVFLAADGRLETVIFCCFGEASVKAHEKAMRVLG